MADFARVGGAGNGIPYNFLASPCLRHKYTETIKLSLVRVLVLDTENTTDCLQLINNQELPSRGDTRVAPEEKLRTFSGWIYMLQWLWTAKSALDVCESGPYVPCV